MRVFEPPVRNRIDFRPSSVVRKQGSLTTLDEAITDIVENPDSYTVSISDEMGDYDRDIPKDWVDSVDLTNNIISFHPPSNPISEYEIDVKDKEVVSKFDSGIAKVLKFQFTVKPNNLTRILNEDKLGDFKDNYYFKDREITSSEFEDLKQEIEEIPVKTVKKGDLEDTKTRPITPPAKGKGNNWIKRGESTKITYTITLVQESRSYAQARFETGNFSISWTVTSDTDFSNGTFSGTNAWRGIGQLELASQEFQDGFEDGDYAEWTEGSGTNTVVSTPASEGSYALCQNGDPVSIYRSVSSPNYISCHIRAANTSDWQQLRPEYNTGTPPLVILLGGKHSSGFGFTWIDSGGTHHDIAPTSADTWYNLEIKNIDYTNQTYDVWVDGTEEVTGATFWNDVGDMGSIDLMNWYNIDGFWDSIQAGAYQSSGLWTSIIWDSGATSKQQIGSFEVNSTVNTPTESVTCRIGVDENDDGTIDTWSHTSGNGVDVTGGTQTFTDSDFNLPPGYRYQIEFNPLEVTDADTTHSPSVQDYTLTTQLPSMDVSSISHSVSFPTSYRELLKTTSASELDASQLQRIWNLIREFPATSTETIDLERIQTIVKSVQALTKDTSLFKGVFPFKIGSVILDDYAMIQDYGEEGEEIYLEFVLKDEKPTISDKEGELRKQAESVEKVEKVSVPEGSSVYQDISLNKKNEIKLKIDEDYLPISNVDLDVVQLDYDSDKEIGQIGITMKFGE